MHLRISRPLRRGIWSNISRAPREVQMLSGLRRRRLLVAAVPLSVLPSAYSRAATPPAIVPGGIPLGLEQLVTTGGPPLALDFAPGDSTGRLFIAGQTTGRVELWKSGATAQTTPFLSTATGGITLSGGSEKGLLGIAFHPNYNAPK